MSSVSGREIELELIRVRAEAAAARLEARAAELELMLLTQQPRTGMERQSIYDPPKTSTIDHRPTQDQAGGNPDNAAEGLMLAIGRLMQEQAAGTSNVTGWESRLQGAISRQHQPSAHNSSTGSVASKDDWQALGGAIAGGAIAGRRLPDQVNERLQQAAVDQFADRIARASSVAVEPDTERKPDAGSATPSQADGHQPVATDRPTAVPAASTEPTWSNVAQQVRPSKKEPSKKLASDQATDPIAKANVTADKHTSEEHGNDVEAGGNRSRLAGQRPAAPAVAVSVAQSVDDREKPKRGRPAGWLVSTLAHILVLLGLGLFTLASPKPKDQLAFSASVSESSETSVETLTIEAIEEMPEVSEPSVAESAADVSPLGTMPMAEVSLDLPTAKNPPMNPAALASELSSQAMKLAKASVKGDTPSNVQFAGVEGGGNHFVYLVDSSNSMKNFNEARIELLRSVDALKPDQRFYVVFYDEQPDYMRISNPSVDEPASVYATPANKQAFRRWAMTIQQQRGKSPPEVLEFAFKLRPDVIFLLSDGEFSAKTEVVIREKNRQENLFGDSGPISIIHTIRYPGVSSTEGRQAEVQMRRIAEENGGQYRNVELK